MAVFAIQACGFTARIALENTGSEGVRLDRLVEMIGECELGIHDLSKGQSRRSRRRAAGAFTVGIRRQCPQSGELTRVGLGHRVSLTRYGSGP